MHLPWWCCWLWGPLRPTAPSPLDSPSDSAPPPPADSRTPRRSERPVRAQQQSNDHLLHKQTVIPSRCQRLKPLWRRRQQRWGFAARRCCSSAAPCWWPGSLVQSVWCGDFSAPWLLATSPHVHTAAGVLPWEMNVQSPEWVGPAVQPGNRGWWRLLRGNWTDAFLNSAFEFRFVSHFYFQPCLYVSKSTFAI